MTAFQDGPSDEAEGWSPVTVAVIAILVLLLGFGGALVGVYAANRPAVAGPGTTPSAGTTPPTSPPTSASPSASGSTTPSSTPSASETPTPTGIPVPEVTDLSFQVARAMVREAGLGWKLVFEGTEGDLSVRKTNPEAGTLVTSGTAVTIFVRGPAPLATVPDVTGQTCGQGANTIIDSGLYPKYRTGRTGNITQQSPLATDPPASHWNDVVDIWCTP